MVTFCSVHSLNQNRVISLFKPSGYPQCGEVGVRGRLITKLATLSAVTHYIHNLRISVAPPQNGHLATGQLRHVLTAQYDDVGTFRCEVVLLLTGDGSKAASQGGTTA